MRRSLPLLFVCAVALAVPLAGQEQQRTVVMVGGPDMRILTEETIVGAAGGRAAPMPLGTGVIVGQVVDGDAKNPVPSALVSLTMPGAQPIRALADSEGRFAFRDLPKGSFSIAVSKPGYVEGASGRLHPSGPSRPVVLEDNGREVAAVIPVWKYAAITGQVVDEHGEPVVNTMVRSLKKSTVAGMMKLTPGPTDYTDDRGIYRITSLEPGEYLVAVPMTQSLGMRDIETIVAGGGSFAAAPVVSLTAGTPGTGSAGVGPDGRPLAFQTQFYPATTDSSRASLVRVESGEAQAGIDFQLRPVTTRRILGRVMGPEGPMARAMVTVVPADGGALVSPIESMTAVTDAAGEFTVDQVPPGNYRLEVMQAPRMAVRGGEPVVMAGGGGGGAMFRTVEALAGMGGPPSNDPTLWAELPVSVGGTDVTDAVLMMRPGARMLGQVEFSGSAQKPEPSLLPRISVMLEPADGRRLQIPLRGRIDANGKFTGPSVPPGKYVLRVTGALQDWAFRGAFHGGRDIADEPVDLAGTDISGIVLRFTDQTTELSGTVSGMNGQRDENATVLVFPVDRDGWMNYGSSPRRLRSVRVDKTGNFSLSGLPPGEYFALAVPESGAVDWQTPANLETLATRARRVQIGEGQKVSQSLEVVR